MEDYKLREVSQQLCDSARIKFPFQLFHDYTEKFTLKVCESKVHGEKWIRDKQIVTPYATEMIQAQRDASGYYYVIPCSKSTTFVRDLSGLHP
jgi:hypothetical protein